MKKKLIKRENHYDLFEGTRFISTTECEDGTVNKLSKQNCDEIFGVMDKEIEVEIVMEDTFQLKKRAGGITNMGKPKLDANGCLMLKQQEQ
jgi:hypothetical protein